MHRRPASCTPPPPPQVLSSSSSSGALLLLLVSSLMMMFSGVSCDVRSQSLLQSSNEDRWTVSPANTMYDEAGRSEEMSIFL